MLNNILAVVVCYNTADQTHITLSRIPEKRNYDVLIVNDCSTDKTGDFINKFNFKVITHKINIGVGATIKTGVKYAIEHDYEVVVILAGNNKDDPSQIPRLIKAIIDEGYDYVQGSRFFRGGQWDNLPLFRFVMVKIHALLFSILTGVRCTDALNGFRAYRLSIFNDKLINIWQDWLDRYEYETYLHYKVLRYGYKFKEVSVSKTYPKDKRIKYTHIRPFIDWWSILRPLMFLLLRIKK